MSTWIWFGMYTALAITFGGAQIYAFGVVFGWTTFFISAALCILAGAGYWYNLWRDLCSHGASSSSSASG